MQEAVTYPTILLSQPGMCKHGYVTRSECSAGAAVSRASSLQAEHSSLSDLSLGLEREQSAQDVLADILGGWGGTSPRSAGPHGPSPSPGT